MWNARCYIETSSWPSSDVKFDLTADNSLSLCVAVKHYTRLNAVDQLWNKKCWVLWVCVCLYSCPNYPACKLHFFCAALYCHPWPVRLYRIFPHYLINGPIFIKKKLLNVKCVFWYSLRRSSEKFLILRRSEWDIIINAHRSLCKVLVFLVKS
jgi:hypothetical protein